MHFTRGKAGERASPAGRRTVAARSPLTLAGSPKQTRSRSASGRVPEPGTVRTTAIFAKCCSFSAVSAPIFASRIFWFQLFLLCQPSKLPKPMKNQETLGNRRFSNKEPHLPFLWRLRRRANFFRNRAIFEKTPIDESLNLSLIHI